MKKAPRAETLERYAQLLKVCGHPLRLQLLFAIEKGESACVKELWKCLKQVQPVVSQHLAVLKDLGVVTCRTVRNRRIYSIADPFVKEMIRLLYEDESLKTMIVRPESEK